MNELERLQRGLRLLRQWTQDWKLTRAATVRICDALLAGRWLQRVDDLAEFLDDREQLGEDLDVGELEEARKNTTLGSYLRAWRVRAGLSVEEVAEALGSQGYEDIEHDQSIVSPEKLKLLCAAIPGTNLVWLTKLRTKLVLQRNAAG